MPFNTTEWPPIAELNSMVRIRMAKYRMDIFKPGRKPGHPEPLVWRRHDIFASDDAAAKAKAEELYCAYAAQRKLTNFYLCDGVGRFIYESPREDSH